mgnify:CR=1 FL=1
MATTIKVMAEYTPYVPIWWEDGERVGPVDPAELGLPEPLIDQFLAWNLLYRSRLNWQDPASTPAMTPDEQQSFEIEGRRLAGLLRSFLGSTYEVVYFSDAEQRLVDLDP